MDYICKVINNEKIEIMNVDTANLTELQNEALFNDELYNFIESQKGNAEEFIGSQSVEELRQFIGDWVINNDDTF